MWFASRGVSAVLGGLRGDIFLCLPTAALSWQEAVPNDRVSLLMVCGGDVAPEAWSIHSFIPLYYFTFYLTFGPGLAL